MGLSVSQINKINLEYERRQALSDAKRQERIDRIYEAIPQLPGIKKEILSFIGRIAAEKDKDKRQLLNGELEALRMAEKRLLSENGFSTKDFEREYYCNACQDTGYIGNKKCSCYRQMEIKLLYANSNLMHCLDEENFDTFSLGYYTQISALNSARRAVGKSKQFIERVITGADSGISDNILLFGTVGTGKTFLTHCIAKELLDNGIVVLYFSAVRLFDILSGLTFGNSKDDGYSRDDIYDTEVLIIDDLGTEMVNDFVRSALFSCINERIIRKKHTVISTNLEIDHLADVYSARNFSRLMGNYELLKMEGDDIRLMKARKQK